jgi:hypothetical protein
MAETKSVALPTPENCEATPFRPAEIDTDTIVPRVPSLGTFRIIRERARAGWAGFIRLTIRRRRGMSPSR